MEVEEVIVAVLVEILLAILWKEDWLLEVLLVEALYDMTHLTEVSKAHQGPT